MIVLDANVLLYAYHRGSQHHETCRAWLEGVLNGSEQVGLPWQTILAFIRMATNPRAFQRPLRTADAIEIVETWLACPPVMVVDPADHYWPLLKQQLTDAQVSGPLVTDAALASLAIEHGAVLCTTDRDFARFRGVKLLDPLESR